jgi:NAD(P)-dependent dehydrogenase (short-subunit alcohol dehydrogenase family)
MDDLASKVAVIAGGSSGIGLALAKAFAAERMRVVIASEDPHQLRTAVEELTAAGAECIGEVVDVSDPAVVEHLKDVTVERFGGVHVICNNAGVSAMGRQWELSLEDWKWVLGVCLGGVVNGIRSFLPHMLASGEPGHVVNTASMGGLLTSPFVGPYAAAKHAVVGLSKGLRAELADSAIGVTVVCPGMVDTPIVKRMRDHMQEVGHQPRADVSVMLDYMQSGVSAGMTPDAAALSIVAAVKANRFWVLPNGSELLPMVQADFDEMLASPR